MPHPSRLSAKGGISVSYHEANPLLLYSPYLRFYRSPRPSGGMAWFYNQLLRHFFEIGLVACSKRQHSPPAWYAPRFTFFLRNSQMSKFTHREKRPKPHF